METALKQNNPDQKNNQHLVAEPSRKKFLVVEDDLSIQPLWERIISLIDPNAVIRWSTTEEGAEKLIQDRLKINDAFDFIITDIILAGQKNGVDLWKKYGDINSLFLFASSVSPRKFHDMVGDCEDRYPFLVNKPLDTAECVDCLKAMLAYKKVFSPSNS